MNLRNCPSRTTTPLASRRLAQVDAVCMTRLLAPGASMAWGGSQDGHRKRDEGVIKKGGKRGHKLSRDARCLTTPSVRCAAESANSDPQPSSMLRQGREGADTGAVGGRGAGYPQPVTNSQGPEKDSLGRCTPGGCAARRRSDAKRDGRRTMRRCTMAGESAAILANPPTIAVLMSDATSTGRPDGGRPQPSAQRGQEGGMRRATTKREYIPAVQSPRDLSYFGQGCEHAHARAYGWIRAHTRALPNVRLHTSILSDLYAHRHARMHASLRLAPPAPPILYCR